MLPSTGRKPETNREVARIFDAQGAGYYRALGRWRAHLRLRRRAVLLPFLAGTVLDAGCGNGEVSLSGGAGGIRAVGLDLSLGMLRGAKHLFPGARLVQADAERLPFAPCRFDAVLCSQAIYLMADPAAFAREAGRVLKPGGSIGIGSNTELFFAASWVISRLARLLGSSHREAPARMRSEAAIRETLARAGFREIRCHRFMVVPFPGFAFLDRTWLGRLGTSFVLTARKPA